jgi:hypothetical protein
MGAVPTGEFVDGVRSEDLLVPPHEYPPNPHPLLADIASPAPAAGAHPHPPCCYSPLFSLTNDVVWLAVSCVCRVCVSCGNGF